MLLAGDVGGTKTLIGVCAPGPFRPTPIEVREFKTLEHDSLGEILESFFRSRHETAPDITRACFGVAGPIVERSAQLVNVPWNVEADVLESGFHISRVELLNDLAATAHAVPVLEPHELVVLQAGSPSPTGNAAVISAGTGLGQALLHNVDGRFVPSPTEAGHADFAPRTPREIELLQWLIGMYGRVDVERVVSGPGIANLFRFTHNGACNVIGAVADSADLPALVSASALEGRCSACRDALDLFIQVFGAEAGNLALRTLATAGVYLGGGIAPKILPAFDSSLFLDAFRAKYPMEELLNAVPVSIILNKQAGLLGAAVAANRMR